MGAEVDVEVRTEMEMEIEVDVALRGHEDGDSAEGEGEVRWVVYGEWGRRWGCKVEVEIRMEIAPRGR